VLVWTVSASFHVISVSREAPVGVSGQKCITGIVDESDSPRKADIFCFGASKFVSSEDTKLVEEIHMRPFIEFDIAFQKKRKTN